jgi:hypothetical protein
MSGPYLYPVSYQIEHGHFSKADLTRLKRGGCDAVIIHSLLYPRDGSRSELILSSDGNGKEISDEEMFKSWISMAKRLSESETLHPGKRNMADVVFNMIRDLILMEREKDPPKNTPA